MPAPALITPPLPEIVASAPGAELAAAAELAVETLELLVVDDELDCCTDERTVDAVEELEDTAAVV